MNKWYGRIGFIETIETAPDVWESKPTERYYRGDVIRNTSKWNSQNSSTNDDINISNSISIVSDPYINNHLQSIRYIEFMGSFWNISSIEVQYPRLIFAIGGVYNGETCGAWRSSQGDSRNV